MNMTRLGFLTPKAVLKIYGLLDSNIKLPENYSGGGKLEDAYK